MRSPPLRADPYRLLGDPVRLRLLRLLARERLNVSELTRVLGIAQSGVSRHVRLLRDGGFLREERGSGWTWLALAEAGPPGLEAAWSAIRDSLEEAGDGEEGDDARLADVRREREERRVGWGPASAHPAQPGRSWEAWARALGLLLPPLEVADLGCGEGALTLEVARWARLVTAVDDDPQTVERARERGRRAGARNVEWVVGALEAPPLPDAAFDLALLSQVLHAVEDPARVVREAVRVTRPGGRVLVLDLLAHGESWVRDRLGHRQLGFEAQALAALLAAAGLVGVACEEAARRRGNPFTVLLARGERPADGSGR